MAHNPYLDLYRVQLSGSIMAHNPYLDLQSAIIWQYHGA